MLKQIDSSETTAGGSGWWVEAEASRARHDWNEVSDRQETPSQKERVGVCFRPRTDGGGTSGHCSAPPLSALTPPAYAGFPTNLLPLRPTVARLANAGHCLSGGVASAPPIPLTQL